MTVLARCAGRGATHIFLCPDMERRYRGHYPSDFRALILSNAWHIAPVETLPGRSTGPMVLGHLSNLGPEKGLGDVLATFRALLARNSQVRLVLAGPSVTHETKKVIEAAKLEFGEALDYRGAVHDDAKDSFYRDIDVFLFPTRYVNEAQPYVIFEAMAHGAPSIAHARGCIAGDLDRGGGVAVPVQDDFVAAALPILSEWAADDDKLREARSHALARSHQHRQLTDTQFSALIDDLAPPAQQ